MRSRDQAVLAIDTTNEYGSIALARGERVDEVAMHSPPGFAHVLYGELQALLERSGARLSEVECFAAASGPGSFTGVRVGLACVKGLAEALAKPAVAVSNLEALATFGSAPLRAAVLDARRGEIYGAVYDAAGLVVSPEVVMKLEAWLTLLPDADLEFVTARFDALPEALSGSRFRNVPVVRAAAQAAAVARIARGRWLRGGVHDPAGLDANYVRRSDAEMFWRE